MRVRGRNYTPRELTTKVASLTPRAYVRNARYVAAGPKRRVTISLVRRLASSPGLLSNVMGFDSAHEMRRWSRGMASITPWVLDPGFVDALDSAVPGVRASAESDGRRALRREFDLLGSGKHVFPGEIDWLTDFKTGTTWPPEFYSSIDYANLDRPSDVKVPWEVSRGHQIVDLARAHLFSPSPQYVEEATAQFRSWIKANPIGRTINWACTMEVAIRAVNWTTALGVFAPELDDETLEQILGSLVAHGVFTAQNLEISEVAGNHFISDALGLVSIGAFFRESILGRRWLALGRRILMEEMLRQVYADGVDHEMSIPYHRLVAEIFLIGGLILKNCELDPDTAYWDRLERMFEFMCSYTRPDGSVPIWGDADDGRVLPIGGKHLTDHRHLLSTAAVVYDRGDFAVTSQALFEDTVWLLGTGAAEAFNQLHKSPAEDPLSVFPEGGFAVMRREGWHVVFDSGPVGLRGRGGHGHNDALATEVWALGSALVVDPGCFVYTPDPAARRAFRSTRAHNTPMLDRHEINEVLGLWQLADDAQAELGECRESREGVVTRGSHRGYQRVVDGASVEREVALSESGCRITDTVGASGAWSVRWTFATDVEIVGVGDSVVQLCRGGTRFSMTVEGADSIQPRRAWVAPSYGVRFESNAVDVAFSDKRCVVRLDVA